MPEASTAQRGSLSAVVTLGAAALAVGQPWAWPEAAATRATDLTGTIDATSAAAAPAAQALWQHGAGLPAVALLALVGAAGLRAGRGPWAVPLLLASLLPAAGYALALLALAGGAVLSVQRLAALDGVAWLAPATAGLAGAWALYFWELLVGVLAVPRVLLPAPSLIGLALLEHAATLRGDFVQTVLKAVAAGYLIGNLAGVATAIAIDRAPFLQRGLLPLASLTSTVPLVGVAPIAVMWFGFDWASKAAVIVLMTFFPALVSTLAGLQAAGRLERELMHSYAAGYRRTLTDLRLPAALPFIFSALKVNATLALIGAIVAEFFGSPTAGLGFRISTEAARMNMPLVWAAIVVASVTGSALYALLQRLERRVNFWHPSVRAA